MAARGDKVIGDTVPQEDCNIPASVSLILTSSGRRQMTFVGDNGDGGSLIQKHTNINHHIENSYPLSTTHLTFTILSGDGGSRPGGALMT